MAQALFECLRRLLKEVLNIQAGFDLLLDQATLLIGRDGVEGRFDPALLLEEVEQVQFSFDLPSTLSHALSVPVGPTAAKQLVKKHFQVLAIVVATSVLWQVFSLFHALLSREQQVSGRLAVLSLGVARLIGLRGIRLEQTENDVLEHVEVIVRPRQQVDDCVPKGKPGTDLEIDRLGVVLADQVLNQARVDVKLELGESSGLGNGPREHASPNVGAAVEQRPVVDWRVAGPEEVLEVGVDLVSEPLVCDPCDLRLEHVEREPLQERLRDGLMN